MNVAAERELLAGLNPAQTDAVLHTEGPLLLVAGPGSGKTRVITHRIAYLTRINQVSPYAIAAVTFTNKAAREMRERIQGLVGEGAAAAIFAGTFHSFCARMLRRYGDGVGLESNYTIYDADDQFAFIKQAMDLAEVDPKRYNPRAVQSAISKAKSLLQDSVALTRQAQLDDNYFAEVSARVYRHYEELLARNNAVDFDDLLLRAVQLLRENADIKAEYQSRYRYLMVDEFQDTNIAQYQLTRLLTGPDQNLCAVGDPDQSIYSWRNADLRNIMSFQRDYPDCRTIAMEQNYRSTQTILQAAGSLIAHNDWRLHKDLTTANPAGPEVVIHEAYTPEEEAAFVVGQISDLQRRQRIPAGHCAVMYRVNAQSRALEEACLRQGMKYRIIGGIRFYQRREIKDLLAYLYILHNPVDEVNLARAVSTPPRGLGSKSMQDLSRWAASRDLSLFDAFRVLAQSRAAGQSCPAPLVSRAYTAAGRFGELLLRLSALKDQLPPDELVKMTLDESGLADHIRRTDDNPEERLENLREFIALAAEYNAAAPAEGLAALLERVSLISDADSYEESEDTLTLITLHQAKGLEFPAVFIVGMEEGLLPHSRAMDSNAEMEEERRLCYVGITRAKERLYLLRSFRRALYGNSGPTIRSRFLEEIPEELTAYARTPGRVSAAANAGNSGGHSSRPAESSPLTEWQRRPAAAAAAPAAPPKPSYIPEIGDRVRHSKFGEGTVMACAEWGNDYETAVLFAGGDLRRLLLSYARLEKVAE